MTKLKDRSEEAGAVTPAAYTTAEAALYVGLAPNTLGNLRILGGGPRFVKYGHRTVRYLKADLDVWMDARRVSSTSERAVA